MTAANENNSLFKPVSLQLWYWTYSVNCIFYAFKYFSEFEMCFSNPTVSA